MKLRVPVLLFSLLLALGGALISNRPATRAAGDTISDTLFIPHITNDFCGSFFDTFDAGDTGWFTGTADGLRAEITGGEYRLLFTGSGTVWLMPGPGCPRAEYHAAVDVRWVGQPGNFIGLLFDIDEDRNRAFLFGINTDTRVWLVFEVRNGSLHTVIEPAGNDAVLPGWSVNRLAAERKGDAIVLSVNGTPVGELRDDQPGVPVVAGVAAAAYTTQQVTDARFDNFLWGPGD